MLSILEKLSRLELEQKKEREPLEKAIARLDVEQKQYAAEEKEASIAKTEPSTPTAFMENEEEDSDEDEKLQLNALNVRESYEEELEALKIKQDKEKEEMQFSHLLKIVGVKFAYKKRPILRIAFRPEQERQPLINSGKIFLESELSRSIHKGLKDLKEKKKIAQTFNQWTSRPELLKVADKLRREYGLPIPSEPSNEDSAINTVYALFGAITQAYKPNNSHPIAKRLISDLWKDNLALLNSSDFKMGNENILPSHISSVATSTPSSQTLSPQTLEKSPQSLSTVDQKEKHALELKGKTGLSQSTDVSFAPPQVTEIKATLPSGQLQKLMTNTPSTANSTTCSSSSSLLSSPSTNSVTQLKPADKEEKEGEKHQPESKEDEQISWVEEIEMREKERENEVKSCLTQLDQKLISEVNKGENLNTFNETIRMLLTQWRVLNAIRSDDSEGKRLVGKILTKLDNLFVLAVIGDNIKFLTSNEEKFSNEEFSNERTYAWWLEAACICGAENVVVKYLLPLIGKKKFEYTAPDALAYAISSGKESLAKEMAKFYKQSNPNSENPLRDIGLFHYYDPLNNNVSLVRKIEPLIL